VLWTASTLVALVLIAALVAWRIRKDSEPEEYKPGEASSDVTTTISDQAARKAVPAAGPTRVSDASRTTDALRSPGRKLPPGAPEPRFTDVTKLAGLSAFRQFQGGRTSQLPEDMGSGVAWGDFDNDGFDDLFVASGGGPLDLPPEQRAPSILYRNLGDGRFEKVQDFPDTRILGMGAAWADYNNDGWLDLVVTGYDTILLFRNDHGHLVRDKALPSPKGFWTGASWGDYNRDGYLDLYICGYVKYVPGRADASASSQQFGTEVPFTLNPASYEPERNLLFRNNGNGTFTEVSKELGVANAEGRSLSALWHDFDGDGWLDLYVANDISENKLYLNDHGKFVDAGRSAWIEEYRGSMGLAAGDFDRDGDDDLFISHWVAQQFALYRNLTSEQKAKPGMKSDLHFTDVAEMVGIGQPSLQMIGWGASFIDMDSDGWPDLVVANGSTFEEKEASPRKLTPMSSFLFWSARGEFFHDLAPWNMSLGAPHVSRGLAVADYNNDGAMDIAIVDHSEGVRLLRNDVPHGNWVEFRLHSHVPGNAAPLGFGDGASVVAWAGNVPLRRTVSSSSYLSQDTRRVHIGLGAAKQIDRLEIQWLGGRTETWTNIEANRIWDVTQGDPNLKPFTTGTAPQLDKTTLASFWLKERAAMDAMKREQNFTRATKLFREALAINPTHEDSHYYLANCLAAASDVTGAISELDTLIRINPQSHRAFQRKGELLAASASSKIQLEAARQVLNDALKLNPEETGVLVLLGQVELAMGQSAMAETTFARACQANSRAANAFFFRGYIAQSRHDSKTAAAMLEAARKARGPDWKPAGSVLEGDVKARMYSESGFLGVFERQWDGVSSPDRAFRDLAAWLATVSK